MNVIKLSAANDNISKFQKKVLDKKEPCIVIFLMPGCGFCKMIKPMWEKMKKRIQPSLNIAEVQSDVSDKVSSMIHRSIPGYPTVLAMRDGTVVDEYKGPPKEDKLLKFAKDNFDDKTVTTTLFTNPRTKLNTVTREIISPNSAARISVSSDFLPTALASSPLFSTQPKRLSRSKNKTKSKKKRKRTSINTRRGKKRKIKSRKKLTGKRTTRKKSKRGGSRRRRRRRRGRY